MAIDNPYVISRDTVKTILQISVSTYDTLIDFYLPIISEDIDSITNQTWTVQYNGTLTNGSAVISSILVGSPTSSGVKFSDYLNRPTKGWLVSTVQNDNSAISDYDLDANTITVSDNATATVTGADVLINQFPKSKWVAAAQMIGFQIVKNNGVDSTSKGNIKSRSMGPLSVTYEELDNALSNGFGYPNYIIQSLKTITIPRFC